MRKYFLYLGLIFAVSLTLYSCLRDHGDEGRNGPDGTFDVSAAKKFFDKEIGSASVFDLSNNALATRSGKGPRMYNPRTDPEWSRGRVYEEDGISIVEIPLKLNGRITALVNVKEGKNTRHEKSNISSVLIVRHKGSVTASMVATILPDREYARTRPADAGPYWHNQRGTGFSGKVIYSDTEGRMHHGVVYVNGNVVNWIWPSGSRPHHHDCEGDCDGEDHENDEEEIAGYLNIKLVDRTMVSMSYMSSWEGDPWECPNGGNCGDPNCLFCAETITMTFCTTCKLTNMCVCCLFCGVPLDAGRCLGKPTDPGDGGNPGGGTGDPYPPGGGIGGGGNPPTPPDPIADMRDKIDNDCMGDPMRDIISATRVTIRYSDTRPPEHIWYEAVYSPSTNSITMYEEEDFILLEELIHLYQHNNYQDVVYSAHDEIEAKLLVWEYCVRNGLADYITYKYPAWKEFSIFAKNPIAANWTHALNGIAAMGYFNESGKPPVVSNNYQDFEKPNYDNLTCQ